MICANKRGVSELKLSKAQSPNISLKDNSNELFQISSNDETSLNNNIQFERSAPKSLKTRW
jgi:hypothetical protein